MVKADSARHNKEKSTSIRPLSSFGILLPYCIIPFGKKSSQALHVFLKTVLSDFFALQFSVKFGFKKIPIIRIDHPLDKIIPFDPSKVHTYLDFTDFWIRPMTLLFKRVGIKKALPYCTQYIRLIETAYAEAAFIYRFRMTTTIRPAYKKDRAFRMIHRLDPHLLCIPSLHVAVVVLTRTYYEQAFKELGFSEEECRVYGEELREGARKIIESVLYIKQHSVNCIPAALYMMLSLLKGSFTIPAGVEIINSLFCDAQDISEDDKKAVRTHIHFMFERLLLEGCCEDDWTVPVKHWLSNFAPIVY
ncbi:hypothetical protein H0R92_09160 [Treponema sp. OMZ 840]|uniref:hypothetical protein n=1 Tax=Treponema sp. OMZ 840 TaxID=244313 RepID=UPI003D91E56C